MKIPNQIVIVTKEYVQIQTKLNLYIAKYGCKAVDSYLDSIPLRMTKVDGKHLGAYIIGKICQEYGITRYDLFESSGRQDNLAEARLFICVLAERYVKLQKTEMSKMFNKSRHFAKRLLHDFNLLDENHVGDKKILARFHRLDALIKAYIDFKPNNIKP
ncbi:MAG: hypothetical protein A3D31_11375 [Candidatus Fluviicola riflensis]|nr:MAG: hypothetical protein CHH17_15800 [Candidatus Fluviicola riflensis]OGS77590.1 MAG: hypothetical protein A3D31_11375 [Candidatus Fluviicola riflensis]OGS84172.1 MAG: hypothetical protein A3E30_12780 [Fluviicola sp. RIFCSPHIGHO2_12_FULL_43_24]OGS84656.1 MAG: hypothetical protein A2724_08310 [Fluviicola sp. RIFCSPHIGHO2_01_FULL_43_53]